MNAALLRCDCDCVVEMEEMGVGANEILQYASAVLSRREIKQLLRDFDHMLEGAAFGGPR